MFFRLPHPPLAFEIPDEWWLEAGAAGFKPKAPSYRAAYSVGGESVVALAEVSPMLRRPGIVRDHHGFRRQGGVDGGPGGMVDVLRAIVDGMHLPAVRVRPIRGISAEGLRYVVQDGFHRLYASHVLGFTHLPCTVEDEWRQEAQFGDCETQPRSG